MLKPKTGNAKLIIHADDFGLTKSVNQGIRRAFQDGILTSTSIMPNAAFFEDAVEIYHEIKNLDFG